jgi:hypothetical protein
LAKELFFARKMGSSGDDRSGHGQPRTGQKRALRRSGSSSPSPPAIRVDFLDSPPGVVLFPFVKSDVLFQQKERLWG